MPRLDDTSAATMRKVLGLPEDARLPGHILDTTAMVKFHADRATPGRPLGGDVCALIALHCGELQCEGGQLSLAAEESAELDELDANLRAPTDEQPVNEIDWDALEEGQPVVVMTEKGPRNGVFVQTMSGKMKDLIRVSFEGDDKAYRQVEKKFVTLAKETALA